MKMREILPVAQISAHTMIGLGFRRCSAMKDFGKLLIKCNHFNDSTIALPIVFFRPKTGFSPSVKFQLASAASCICQAVLACVLDRDGHYLT